MKLKLAAILVSLVATSAMAQTISTSVETEEPVVYTSKGIRAIAVKSLLTTRTDIDNANAGIVGRRSKTYDEAFGLGLGYADVPIREVGYIVSASYNYLGSEADDIGNGLVRAEANIASAWNSKLYGKLGANLSQYTMGELQDLRMGLGGQASVGYQITSQLGIDVGFAYMTQGGNTVDGREASSASGFEAGVTGTF